MCPPEDEETFSVHYLSNGSEYWSKWHEMKLNEITFWEPTEFTDKFMKVWRSIPVHTPHSLSHLQTGANHSTNRKLHVSEKYMCLDTQQATELLL